MTVTSVIPSLRSIGKIEICPASEVYRNKTLGAFQPEALYTRLLLYL